MNVGVNTFKYPVDRLVRLSGTVSVHPLSELVGQDLVADVDDIATPPPLTDSFVVESRY